ncbi:MAG TPA: FecR family protein [Candidatus Tumulicola sp.]
MRLRHVSTLAACFGLVLAGPALADDKQLQSQKGTVSYQVPNGKPIALSVKASVGLADRDYTITGGDSLAQVTLPDSSQVLVGSDSKVQLAFFNQSQIASAKFVVFNGKVRFAVRHPQGAKANYTFSTATATVGVRGTEGDIEYAPDGTLRVNVYEVCNPNAPVVVTTTGGSRYDVKPGQSLLAQTVGGVVQAQVMTLTQQIIDQFSPDFGVPTNWDEATGEVVGYAQSTAAGAVNSATGGIAGGVAGSAVSSALGGLFHKSQPAPSASPSAASSTCH